MKIKCGHHIRNNSKTKCLVCGKRVNPLKEYKIRFYKR